jgi:hypothetical protein
MLLTVMPGPARAQQTDGVTERLIQILVKNGVLTQAQAASLLEEARKEARNGKPAAPAVAPAVAAQTPEKPVAPGSVRVTYVPEAMRKQIAAEVKQQVLQQAEDEGWAEPNVVPQWTQRVRVFGDVRIREQSDLFPRGNYNLFPDFNAINSSSNGFDTNGTALPPLLNSTEDRLRTRLRARLGVEADIADWAKADIRIATGSDNSPVSTNQTLGSTGDFTKYALWLDQAYITMKPFPEMTVTTGRMPNPFWTSDLIYDEDLNFDGFAVASRFGDPKHFGEFFTIGGFPVFNTAFNFGSTNDVKTSSHDSWLLAVQGGTDWRPVEDVATRLALGYFTYANVQGKESALCVAPSTFGSCGTDATRAPFAQFGNSMFPIRNISNAGSTSVSQPEYYGLASKFNVLDVRLQGTYLGYHPVDISLEGDFAKNLGFDQTAILKKGPVNNLGNGGTYSGGDTAWMIRMTAGHLELKQAWDWNVSLAYKYVESDAVLDALTDSKFHLGGTNAKGIVMAGNLALAPNLWLSMRWYSTDAISGPPFAVDSILFDLNAKF